MDGRVMVVLAVFLLGGVALLGMLGGSDGDGAETATGETVAALSAGAAAPVVEHDGMTVARGPVAATEHLAAVRLDEVLEGYLPPLKAVATGPADAARVAQDCRFAPPAAGSRVANVHAGVPAMETRLRIRQGAGDAEAQPTHVMEIAVTETEVPVHLVLQADAARILWNLSFAEGAHVSGVSLLGGTAPAVANLPDGVAVEAMDTAAMAACGIVPARALRESAPLFRAVGAGTVSEADARAELSALDDRIEAWNGWFARQFGLRSDETRIGYDSGGVAAAVGPLPSDNAPRARHRALLGAPLVVAGGTEALAAGAMPGTE